jgi:hypothetical protein
MCNAERARIELMTKSLATAMVSSLLEFNDHVRLVRIQTPNEVELLSY